MERSRPFRASLIEYDAASTSLRAAESALGLSADSIARDVLAAGERIEHVLRLPGNPFTFTGGRVRVVDIAGLVRVGPRLELEIAPKFLGFDSAGWREDFFFLAMLSRHGRVLAHERLSSARGPPADLATLAARALVQMFWDNHRRPLRTYRQADIEDFAVDGDVEAETILLPSSEGYLQRVVMYDRRNVFNAAILAAAARLLEDVRDPATRSQLQRLRGALAPQAQLRTPQHRRLPSRAMRWQSVHELAIDILRGFGIAYSTGSFQGPGFVINTWRVWEDVLTLALRSGWGASAVKVQRPAPLGVRIVTGMPERTAWVFPDASVAAPGLTTIVDAKYKGRQGDSSMRIAEGDLYEALAFASATRCPRIALLYPTVARSGAPRRELGSATPFERVAVKDVVVTGLDVEVRGISGPSGFQRFSSALRTSLLTHVGSGVHAPGT